MPCTWYYSKCWEWNGEQKLTRSLSLWSQLSSGRYSNYQNIILVNWRRLPPWPNLSQVSLIPLLCCFVFGPVLAKNPATPVDHESSPHTPLIFCQPPFLPCLTPEFLLVIFLGLPSLAPDCTSLLVSVMIRIEFSQCPPLDNLPPYCKKTSSSFFWTSPSIFNQI